MPSGANSTRSYAVTHFAIEFGNMRGTPIGFIKSIDGGGAEMSLAKHQVGSNLITSHIPSAPKYHDINITVGMSSSVYFWKWVQECLDNKPTPRDLAVVQYDSNGKERSRREFTSAVLSEVSFPSLQAGSSAASQAYVQIKISPETLEYERDGGGIMSLDPAAREIETQKLWTNSRFEFSADNLFGKNLRYARIGALNFRQPVIDFRHAGRGGMVAKRQFGVRVDMPLLQVSFPETNESWWKRFKETSVGNKRIHDTGALEFLGNDPKKGPLMSVEFQNLGIHSVTWDRWDATKPDIARVTVNLHFDRAQVKPGRGNAGFSASGQGSVMSQLSRA